MVVVVVVVVAVVVVAVVVALGLPHVQLSPLFASSRLFQKPREMEAYPKESEQKRREGCSACNT
eukprot:710356-Pyramimonas_sp.AAC.3